MSKSLEGKVAIVTGSSSGIGEAIAIKFAQHGACVTLCGRDVHRLQTASEKCQAESGSSKDTFLIVAGDVKNTDFRNSIVDLTVQRFGKLDIVVANAAVLNLSIDVDDETEESFDTVLSTNLKSVYFLIQRALPHLEKTKGSIVCVSTMATRWTLPMIESYQMSKAGMEKLVESLAFSQASKGIRVNAMCPGPVPTPTSECSFGALLEAAQYTVLGRPSSREEQAEVALFLASSKSLAINGQSIMTDAGFSLGHKDLLEMLKQVKDMKKAQEGQEQK